MMRTAAALSILLFQLGLATIRYVDVNSSGGTGILSSPYVTIQECVDNMEDGDECHIREGEYYEEVYVNGKNNVVIRGYQNERPVLVGAQILEPMGSSWGNANKDGIYKSRLRADTPGNPGPIWQLFACTDSTVDSCEMMTNARWPDAKWSDKTVFQGDQWAQVHEDVKKGSDRKMINKDSSLGDLDLNLDGAMAVMNIGKWNTFVAQIKHNSGDNEFTYDNEFRGWDAKKNIFKEFKIDAGHSRYFLEDHMALLNAQEEWFYRQRDQKLFFIPNNDFNKDTTVFRGKTQTYALTIENSESVTIENLKFFATTMQTKSVDKDNFVKDIKVQSNVFKYPSYSKRMLQDASLIEWTNLDGKPTGPKSNRCSFLIHNNEFYGSDGVALAYSGKDNSITNNLFEYNDWTSANMMSYEGGRATILSDSSGDTIQHNTLINNGNGCGIRPSLLTNTAYNHIKGQCFGFQQNDGAGIQVTIKAQADSYLKNNWIHDSPKFGLRFDSPMHDGDITKVVNIGRDGTMEDNVVWNCNGLMLKGDYQTARGNLVFNKFNGPNPLKSGYCALCVWRHILKSPQRINKNSDVEDNISDRANGGKIWDHITNPDKPSLMKDSLGEVLVYPVSGDALNNLFGVSAVGDNIMDANNMDFRPIEGESADLNKVGPYEVNNELYWIPGRRAAKASMPIPPNNSVTVKATARDYVMWQPCLESTEMRVYLGLDKAAVSAASGEGHALHRGTTTGHNNMVSTGNQPLQSGETYFWRVDCTNDQGVETRGDVWVFTTI